MLSTSLPKSLNKLQLLNESSQQWSLAWILKFKERWFENGVKIYQWMIFQYKSFSTGTIIKNDSETSFSNWSQFQLLCKDVQTLSRKFLILNGWIEKSKKCQVFSNKERLEITFKNKLLILKILEDLKFQKLQNKNLNKGNKLNMKSN